MTAKEHKKNKRHILSCMLMVCALACMNMSSAMAGVLGEINIRLTGTIVALGCNVDPGDLSKNVELGSWPTKQLRKFGDHTHYVPFHIYLSGCTASGVTIAFSGTKDPQDDSLLALSDDSSASGVGVQILDSNQNRVPMGEDAPRVVVDSNGDATLSFYASYVVTGDSVSPGTANADTEFTLTYD